MQPAVALNNAEMALAGREQEEEAAVLFALSDMVSDCGGWLVAAAAWLLGSRCGNPAGWGLASNKNSGRIWWHCLPGVQQPRHLPAAPDLELQVAQHAQQLRGVLSSITALDVASARARHAAWLGATAPPCFLSAEEAAAGGPVQLPRAWHPLLLQACLPPLPSPPLSEDELQALGASQAQDAAAQRCAI